MRNVYGPYLMEEDGEEYFIVEVDEAEDDFDNTCDSCTLGRVHKLTCGHLCEANGDVLCDVLINRYEDVADSLNYGRCYLERCQFGEVKRRRSVFL